MRSAVAALLALTAATPLAAETCTEKFQRILVERNPPRAVKITHKVKGAPATRNINWQAGPRPLDDGNARARHDAWTLVAGGVMYTSSDKGKTWNKVRTMDSGANADQYRRILEAAAATVKDAACGSEEIDGVPHETIEASYAIPAYKTEHLDKYWIDPKTGRIPRLESITRMSGFESTTTQVIEKAPGLALPKPE
jgi:hypothetical protein